VYYCLRFNGRLFRKLDNKLAYYPKVTFSEQAPALILAAFIFILGIQPTWLFRWMEPTAQAMVIALNQSVPTQIAIK
jgi:NAD(P)H-quinone oxidoreductase subunit 4